MARRGFLAALGLLAKPKFRDLRRQAEINKNEELLLIGLCYEDKNVDQVIDFLPEPMTPTQYKRNIKILETRLKSWCSNHHDFFTDMEREKVSPFLAQKQTKNRP